MERRTQVPGCGQRRVLPARRGPRRLGGRVRHDETAAAGPFLGDTLAMGSAFFALHQATGDAAWLARAEGAADFIRGHFARGAEPGFATSDTTSPSFPASQPEFDESICLARFGNLQIG